MGKTMSKSKSRTRQRARAPDNTDRLLSFGEMETTPGDIIAGLYQKYKNRPKITPEQERLAKAAAENAKLKAEVEAKRLEEENRKLKQELNPESEEDDE